MNANVQLGANAEICAYISCTIALITYSKRNTLNNRHRPPTRIAGTVIPKKIIVPYCMLAYVILTRVTHSFADIVGYTHVIHDFMQTRSNRLVGRNKGERFIQFYNVSIFPHDNTLLHETLDNARKNTNSGNSCKRFQHSYQRAMLADSEHIKPPFGRSTRTPKNGNVCTVYFVMCLCYAPMRKRYALWRAT